MYKFIGIVLLVLSSMSVLAGDPIKCKGKTKAGHDCKSTIVSKSTGYCNAHDPNKIKCKAKQSYGVWTIRGNPVVSPFIFSMHTTMEIGLDKKTQYFV
jgi:hypothetical protein